MYPRGNPRIQGKVKGGDIPISTKFIKVLTYPYIKLILDAMSQ